MQFLSKLKWNGPELRTTQPTPMAMPTSSMTSVHVGSRPSRDSLGAGPTLGDLDEHPAPQTINVILFGEAGVGKSSVVNLIAQRETAKVSPDVVGCTLQSTRHDIPIDGTNYCIFDTVGLNQPELVATSHLDAIESAYKLILGFTAVGGIHLLLFCMRRGKITMTQRNNYRLFYEFLCQRKVPVAVVVTGCEYEVEMENWWTRNKTDIERFGIKSHGHACITAVTDSTLSEASKYRESQRKIRELLNSSSLKNGAFLLDVAAWLGVTGKQMKSLVKEGKTPKRREVEKVLSKRLRVRPNDVKRILDIMEKNEVSNGDGN